MNTKVILSVANHQSTDIFLMPFLSNIQNYTELHLEWKLLALCLLFVLNPLEREMGAAKQFLSLAEAYAFKNG